MVQVATVAACHPRRFMLTGSFDSRGAVEDGDGGATEGALLEIQIVEDFCQLGFHLRIGGVADIDGRPITPLSPPIRRGP